MDQSKNLHDTHFRPRTDVFVISTRHAHFPQDFHHCCHDMRVSTSGCHSHHKKCTSPLALRNFKPQACSCWLPCWTLFGLCWPLPRTAAVALEQMEAPAILVVRREPAQIGGVFKNAHSPRQVSSGSVGGADSTPRNTFRSWRDVVGRSRRGAQ